MASTARILLVEDDLAHAELIRRSLDRQEITYTLDHVKDGEEALDFLLRPDAPPRPDVILLDLHLPKIDGLSVLEAIRATPALAAIPVIILTTSSSHQDMIRAQALKVNYYLVKPLDFSRLGQVLRELGLN